MKFSVAVLALVSAVASVQAAPAEFGSGVLVLRSNGNLIRTCGNNCNPAYGIACCRKRDIEARTCDCITDNGQSCCPGPEEEDVDLATCAFKSGVYIC